MKALILSGGKGTRLRPLTYSGAKQLVPVANKPILWYGIEALVAAGITDIGIVVSPETGGEVKAATGDGERFGAQITYVLQAKPAGLAHAVQVAQPFLAESPFVMYLGDNLVQDSLTPMVETFKERHLDALTLLSPVPNPQSFGVAEVDAAGRILRLEEKPQQPASNLALVGVYLFASSIHAVIATLHPSARGELEITDAIQELINQHYRVEAIHLQGWWLDTGKKDDLLEANRIILDTYSNCSIEGTVDEQSRVIGRVSIGERTQVRNCTIRGPVIIGNDCQLENCFVGPYSSIGNQVTLTDVDLDHSVILQGARVENIHHRIVDSLVGRRASLKSAPRHPNAMRFMVGDDCQIELTSP
ncbi:MULTISPECIES: glucose-1-phosphate thymidylyltransferase [Cyanophyceae]|uniref:glucose-1-phosphate thymidylyltransferase n=1 Tax=Cyanophyceae TaxID=3028117 RepID=UPI001688AE45|nr:MULTISPECIES: glucose-1-phosphate thymidylyltransferase [Cyanophyceae]MBD1914260.1 glucose-1-phosphate thymidylyltransferase [Phormidium sp. FACHB-77]MBD2032383.1 glucose-1-phosphate thymidylyltransferase [Phormidium sp. FACHB-322]MBD2052143.1 glucose-1-phosphate thymidylyltransferase [Leptolyngbya sp. FACHB-60]